MQALTDGQEASRTENQKLRKDSGLDTENREQNFWYKLNRNLKRQERCQIWKKLLREINYNGGK